MAETTNKPLNQFALVTFPSRLHSGVLWELPGGLQLRNHLVAPAQITRLIVRVIRRAPSQLGAATAGQEICLLS